MKVAIIPGHNAKSKGVDSDWLEPEFTYWKKHAKTFQKKLNALGIQSEIFLLSLIHI